MTVSALNDLTWSILSVLIVNRTQSSMKKKQTNKFGSYGFNFGEKPNPEPGTLTFESSEIADCPETYRPHLYSKHNPSTSTATLLSLKKRHTSFSLWSLRDKGCICLLVINVSLFKIATLNMISPFRLSGCLKKPKLNFAGQKSCFFRKKAFKWTIAQFSNQLGTIFGVSIDLYEGQNKHNGNVDFYEDLTPPQWWSRLIWKLRNSSFENNLQRKNIIAFLGSLTDVITICQGQTSRS